MSITNVLMALRKHSNNINGQLHEGIHVLTFMRKIKGRHLGVIHLVEDDGYALLRFLL